MKYPERLSLKVPRGVLVCDFDPLQCVMRNCSRVLRIAVSAVILGCATCSDPSNERRCGPPNSFQSVSTVKKIPLQLALVARTEREFMVIAWYPAEANSSEVHALWMPERWELSEARLLYAERANSPMTMAEAFHAVHDSVSSSIAEAPAARTRNLWPLLLFAPGAGVNPAFYSTFTEDLASHGYAVFAIVPTGWGDTTFRIALPLWASDLRFMLGQIERLDRDPKSIFSQRLDLGKIGAFGHSFGGAASILAGLQDQRIKAVLNLDGSPFGVLSKTVLPKPLMVIKEDVSPKYWTPVVHQNLHRKVPLRVALNPRTSGKGF